MNCNKKLLHNNTENYNIIVKAKKNDAFCMQHDDGILISADSSCFA